MSEPQSTVEEWRRLFDGLEKSCPWAGPRPQSRKLDSNAGHRFVERTDETAEFLNTVDENSLVVFHGESGAGKSSLLNMGLIDGLRDGGYSTYVWRDWGPIGVADPDQFLADSLRNSNQLHPAIVERLGRGDRLVPTLDAAYGERAVILLDQFESLIRQRSDAFSRMAEWVLQVNRSHSVRVVISLRSEYQHRLARVIHRAKPFTTSYFELRPMESAHQIRAVIDGPKEVGGISAIDEAAASLLMERWQEVKDRQHEAPRLLAVQACLYSLNLMARERSKTDDAVVTSLDVDTLYQDAQRRNGGGQSATDLFTYSFERAIEGRLRHCQDACDALGDRIPLNLRSLTRASVVAAVGHLSSGGYKLERSVSDLLVRSLDREFRLAGWGVHTASTAIQSLTSEHVDFDYLAVSRDELATACAVPRSTAEESTEAPRRLAERQGVFPVVPWLDDPDDISAGPLLGFGHNDLLLEHLRAFRFAIDWLETAFLVNLVSGGDSVIVSLVHDGFGGALETWADRVATEPMLAVSALVAYEGRRFDWSRPADSEAIEPFENGADTPGLLANLRWRYCRVIGTIFRSVVFLNCDFRGAVFQGCTFEGVTFVNCLVDGSSFVNCTIVGPAVINTAPPDEEVETSEVDLPGFLIDGPASATLAQELAWYRQGRATGESAPDCIYSPTSGVAAVPWHRAAVREGLRPWEAQRGGLVMYGGRLSSLMVSACTFEKGGELALCYMAGSSLDFAEQQSGRVSLYFSTVRGLAVTGPVEPGRRDAEASFTLEAYECVLAGTFFGEGLSGSVQLRESKILGISNASTSLVVELDDCKFANADNVEVKENSGRFQGFGTGTISEFAQMTLAEETRRMTYRSIPARLEVETRSRTMPESKA